MDAAKGEMEAQSGRPRLASQEGQFPWERAAYDGSMVRGPALCSEGSQVGQTQGEEAGNGQVERRLTWGKGLLRM